MSANRFGWLQQLSACIARYEKRFAGVLAFVMFVLILANIITRTLKLPIFWIDELAVYMMIWMAFLAASAGLHTREHISVTLLADMVPQYMQRGLAIVIDCILILFGSILLALAWVWFAPADMLVAGFDRARFTEETLNFIYSEPTVALGVPKFLFWLIMPLFSINVIVHSFARLMSPFPVPSTTEGEAV